MVKVRKLIWDAGNKAHIARHGVIPDEVEQVCHGNHEEMDGKEGRIIVIGLTQEGRMLSAILDPEEEPEVYYPVSARDASRKERRYYREKKRGQKGGEETDEQEQAA
jgi:uncharacterized DUF497 family protein